MKGHQLLIIMMFLSVAASAQGIDPGLPGGDPDVPLDGGLGALIVAGIVYGAKKIRDSRP